MNYFLYFFTKTDLIMISLQEINQKEGEWNNYVNETKMDAGKFNYKNDFFWLDEYNVLRKDENKMKMLFYLYEVGIYIENVGKPNVSLESLRGEFITYFFLHFFDDKLTPEITVPFVEIPNRIFSIAKEIINGDYSEKLNLPVEITNFEIFYILMILRKDVVSLLHREDYKSGGIYYTNTDGVHVKEKPDDFLMIHFKFIYPRLQEFVHKGIRSYDFHFSFPKNQIDSSYYKLVSEIYKKLQ